MVSNEKLSMRITYACPACQTTAQLDGIESRDALECPACHAVLTIPAGAIDLTAQGGPQLQRCLVCPSQELFVRKDFPQRVGVAIVVAGLAASCVAWANRELIATFGILFGTALLDVVLFFVMPNCLSCYRCAARYNGAGVGAEPEKSPSGGGQFGSFNLETHEKHRQIVARTPRAVSEPNTPTS